jgi:hypothetical protein
MQRLLLNLCKCVNKYRNQIGICLNYSKLTVVSSSWSTWKYVFVDKSQNNPDHTWSYSDMATQNIIAVTSSKQWIHFFLSDRWPPTSNNLKIYRQMIDKPNKVNFGNLNICTFSNTSINVMVFTWNWDSWT